MEYIKLLHVQNELMRQALEEIEKEQVLIDNWYNTLVKIKATANRALKGVGTRLVKEELYGSLEPRNKKERNTRLGQNTAEIKKRLESIYTMTQDTKNDKEQILRWIASDAGNALETLA